MKKIFLLFLMVFASFMFGQDQLKYATQTPLYLVDGVIASSDFMDRINPNMIESVSIFKSKTPNNPYTEFQPHLKSGIIDIKMKKYQEFKTKVQLSKLNLMHQLPEDSPVYVDGYLVKNNSLEIFDEAMDEVQITKNNSVRVLNIKTSDNKGKGIRLYPNSSAPKSKRPVYLKQIK